MSFSHNPVPREWSFIGWVLFQKHSIRHILNFMLIKGLHQVFRRKPYMRVLISGCPNNTYGCPMPENTSIKRTGKTGRTRFLSPMPLRPKYWCPAGWQEFVPLHSVPISKRFSPEHSGKTCSEGSYYSRHLWKRKRTDKKQRLGVKTTSQLTPVLLDSLLFLYGPSKTLGHPYEQQRILEMFCGAT